MRRVLMLPTAAQAEADKTNSIHQIVLMLRDHLPAYGYEFVAEGDTSPDLIVGQAGQTYSRIHPDVAMLHGFYPTAYPHLTEPWHGAANQGVVDNMMGARAVTVPSQWVADIVRRDCHLDPYVIPWGLNVDEWTPGENQGHVLWNKTRPDGVCDPKPALQLAFKVPNSRFVSTFGDGAPSNMAIIGRQPYEKMREIIRGTDVYLATTKETFGIGILEAMACGVPVLGYRHGNITSLVHHGVNGYLVEPGDLDGLIAGLEYCRAYRKTLGDNGRAIAALFTWDKVAQAVAKVYDSLFDPIKATPTISVVIPYFNYARFVETAIDSVLSQVAPFTPEIVVVNDGSDPGETQALRAILADHPEIILIEQANTGVAGARNAGIKAATGRYIVCLDADDALGNPAFLQTLADQMDADRALGIAFTGITMMNEQGDLGAVSQWPRGFDWEAQVGGKNQVPTCCMFRREAWRRAGGFKSKYTPAEDAELWLRIVGLGWRAKHAVDAGWFYYRAHKGSLSSGVREGKSPEPDWHSDKPWAADRQYNLAANGVARPVRNYDRPKVSIIIPVGPYHVPYLSQAIDSVEMQTERYWECIVVNDTGAPLPGLAPYPFVRVIDTGGNKGAGFARNLGLRHATAPLTTFLDADDMIMPTFLEKTIRMYQRSGRYVYTDWLSVNKQGEIEPHNTPEFEVGDVFRQPMRHSINILIRTEWAFKAGLFDESMASWEDVDFFMRLATVGICGVRVCEPLVVYRYLTGQLRERGEAIRSAIIDMLNERYRDYIGGIKMCGCSNSTPGKQGAISQDGAAQKPGELVRIVYNGPAGNHDVISPNTRKSYGRRAGGDTFYVYAIDAQQYPGLFTVIAEVLEEARPTPTPQPPVPLRAEAEAV